MLLIIADNKNNQELDFVNRSILPYIHKNFEIISLEDLYYNSKLELNISNEVDTFTISLKDGRVIRDADITHCLNMVPHVTSNYFNKFIISDRDYVTQEWGSIFLSMLYILKSKMLFNEPKPLYLKGESLTVEEFLIKAKKYQLPVRNFSASYTGENGFVPFRDNLIEVSILYHDGSFFCDERLVSLIPKEILTKITAFCMGEGFKSLELIMEISSFGIFFKAVNPDFSLLNQRSEFIHFLTQKLNA